MSVATPTHEQLKVYYGKILKSTGDRTTHYGPFDCGPAMSKTISGDSSPGGACC